MKITTDIKLSLKTKEVEDKVKKATKQGLADVVRDIANDAIKLSPKKDGENMRSIKYEVGPGGEVAKGELEGAVYSTSGYGGYLEVGTGLFGPKKQMIIPRTAKMLVWEGKGGKLIFAKAVRGRPATPYFKPALDKNAKNLPKNMKAHLGSG